MTTLLGQATPSVSARNALKDCIFLSLVVALSLVLYVQGLGFYSDDWILLVMFVSSDDQSLSGLFQTVYLAQPWARMRPVQLFYMAGLYRSFGLNPLGLSPGKFRGAYRDDTAVLHNAA